MGRGNTTALPAKVAPLEQLVIELRQQNSYLASRAAALEEELRLLRAKIFGRRSEQLSAEELKLAGLFNEAELPPPTVLQPDASIEVAAHRRARPGRTPLPADLPREDVIHDIPEEEKTCRCCGAPLVRIREATSEQLEYGLSPVSWTVRCAARLTATPLFGGVSKYQPTPKDRL